MQINDWWIVRSIDQLINNWWMDGWMDGWIDWLIDWLKNGKNSYCRGSSRKRKWRQALYWTLGLLGKGNSGTIDGLVMVTSLKSKHDGLRNRMYEIIEGRMSGKPTRERKRIQMLHDLAKDDGYASLNEQHRSKKYGGTQWLKWSCEAGGGRLKIRNPASVISYTSVEQTPFHVHAQLIWRYLGIK